MESKSNVFTATVESSITRTALSNDTNVLGCYSLFWMSGDEISISDYTTTAFFKTTSNLSSSAEFVCDEGKISYKASEYVAFYPSTITLDNMILPAKQTYVEGNVANFPMRAVASNKNLAFKNLCGIIRFSLKSEENNQFAISSIALSADKGMSGTFSIGDDNAAIVTGTDGVVLECLEPELLNISKETDFNIIVPQGSYNSMRVKISDDKGNEVNLVAEASVVVKRSEITCLSLTIFKATFDALLENIPITDSNVDFSER